MVISIDISWKNINNDITLCFVFFKCNATNIFSYAYLVLTYSFCQNQWQKVQLFIHYFLSTTFRPLLSIHYFSSFTYFTTQNKPHDIFTHKPFSIYWRRPRCIIHIQIRHSMSHNIGHFVLHLEESICASTPQWQWPSCLGSWGVHSKHKDNVCPPGKTICSCVSVHDIHSCRQSSWHSVLVLYLPHQELFPACCEKCSNDSFLMLVWWHVAGNHFPPFLQELLTQVVAN